MFLAAFDFAGSAGKNALRLRLADALASVGFDSFHRGEGPFFGAFPGAFCGHFFTVTRRLQRAGIQFVLMADTNRADRPQGGQGA